MPSEAKPAESYVEKPKTLAELRSAIAAGATKATDLAASYYDRIAAVNPRLNVYLSLTKERALAQAARVDELAAKGDPLPALAGIPVGIKDVLVMKFRAARAAARRQQWRPTWPWQRWAPTPADRFASQPVFVEWWVCCPLMGASRATG